MDIIRLIFGLVLILLGASILTDGASAVARKFGLSDFIIGLTIVAMGTSMPELVVSLFSAIEGNADMAVGNVIGSNIFNILLILGLTSLVVPIGLTGGNVRKDIPFGLLASTVLLIVGSDIYLDKVSCNVISRADGLIFLCFFIVFMVYTWLSSEKSTNAIDYKNTGKSATQENKYIKSPSQTVESIDSGSLNKFMKFIKTPWAEQHISIAILFIILGLCGLIFGGDLFLGSAQSIAHRLGIPDSVIAITLMAGGTSLPELASCLVAAFKGKSQMALGNVIGSNIFNIFLVLGLSSLVTPLSMKQITNLDLGVLVFSSVLLFISAFTFRKREIDRVEGGIMVLMYVGYIWWLV